MYFLLFYYIFIVFGRLIGILVIFLVMLFFKIFLIVLVIFKIVLLKVIIDIFLLIVYFWFFRERMFWWNERLFFIIFWGEIVVSVVLKIICVFDFSFSCRFLLKDKWFSYCDFYSEYLLFFWRFIVFVR